VVEERHDQRDEEPDNDQREECGDDLFVGRWRSIECEVQEADGSEKQYEGSPDPNPRWPDGLRCPRLIMTGIGRALRIDVVLRWGIVQ